MKLLVEIAPEIEYTYTVRQNAHALRVQCIKKFTIEGKNKLKKKLIILATVAVLAFTATASAVSDVPPPVEEQPPLQAMYTTPAEDWESEATPMGNGFIGAMIFGGVDSDRIQLNEHTLWSGGPGADPDYNGGMSSATAEQNKENLMFVRSELQELMNEFTEHNSSYIDDDGNVVSHDYPSLSSEITAAIEALKGDKSLYGNYQSIGDIYIDDINHSSAEVENYRRILDIDNAVTTLTYTLDGVDYTREYFVSNPDNFMAIRLTASEAGALDKNIRFTTPQPLGRITSDGESCTITMTGRPQDHRADIDHLEFALQIKVISDGEMKASNSSTISVTGADEIIIYMTAGTNYQQCMDDSFDYFSDEIPLDAVSERIETVSAKDYDDLKQAHIDDYRSLYSRVTLSLCGATQPTKSTRLLFSGYKYDINTPEENRYLEILYYQFGRYLLISSSREGSLPANLQGIWADGLYPPWNSDYHANINIQMNYWLAESTNLTECHLPMIDYINSLVPRGEITAYMYHCTEDGEDVRGWTTYHENNIWGNTGPAVSEAFYYPAGAAWMCQDIWELYAFTMDEEFLAENFDTMKQAAIFWVDNLVTDERDGTLVSSPSWSPEHGPYSLGAFSDQAIIWDLFNNTLEAAEILGIEDSEIDEIRQAFENLSGPKIGKAGQFQEWKDEITMDITGDYGHRHANHLFALHPGRQVVVGRSDEDDAFADAMRVTLETRGDGGTGWSKAWKINFWARLHDGDHAGVMVNQILKESTYDNLFDTHPPFQIDGNFGATAGMTEMLLQSHGGAVDLLPAVPTMWSSGKVEGLRARGNIEVDISWSDNVIQTATLQTFTATEDLEVKGLEIEKATITDSMGNVVKTSARSKGSVTFDAAEGETYTISFDGKGGTNWLLIGACAAGGIVVIAAIVIIAVSSKKKKAAK